MTHQDGFLTGLRDMKIYYQCWLPDNTPKAILLVVHGLGEHCGRYMNVVNHCVPLGYAVYGLDHPGHGRSEGKRVYVERFDDFIQTLKQYADMVRDWQPDIPIFLLGHSMGGLISSIYLLDYQAGLSGVILSGPAVKPPKHISPPTILLGKIFSALLPGFGLIQLETEGVSRDPEVIQALIDDPRVSSGKFTARLGAEIFRAMQRITAEAATITLPILLLQGSADRLVEPDGARMLYDTISSTDKTLKSYEGFYHEVFNEPEHERKQVLHDVEIWLEAHVSSLDQKHANWN